MYTAFPQQTPPRPPWRRRLGDGLRAAWVWLERVSMAGEAMTRRGGWSSVGAVRALGSAAGATAARLRSAPGVSRLGPGSIRPHHMGVAISAVLLLDILLWQTCGLRGCPDVRLLNSYTASGAVVLIDREGEEVVRLRPVQREVVSLDSIPAHLFQAFIAVEDRRFYAHTGIDWVRVGGALLENMRRREVVEGGSTITMQLARNLFADEVPARERTLRRKLLEARVAREIERHFEKHEILELYLNHIYLGAGAYGVEAAARKYYDKPAAELSLSESALLAALPKAPTHYDPRRRPEHAGERRGLVLERMLAQGVITAEEAESTSGEPLGVLERARRGEEGPYLAPWFVERVRVELEAVFGESLYRQPLRVYTTMDGGVQRAAEAELRRQLASVERGLAGRFQGPTYASARESDTLGTGYLQGALVMLDSRTGDVLAYVGGRDFEDSPYDRARDGFRQLGSTFKPFVYAAGIGEGVPASTLLYDSPVQLVVDGRLWEPRNYDGRYRGNVALRDALVYSLNVPTVLLAQAVGVSSIQRVAYRTGVRRPMPQSPVVALGVVETNAMELALAFSAFANLGERVLQPRFVLHVEDEEGRVVWRAPAAAREPALDPAVAYIVTDMLRDAVRRGTGTGALAGGFRGAVAGKTGTTNDAADAWFVGYTPDMVGAVWVGFDQRRPIAAQATGGRISAPIWGRVIPEVYATREAAQDWGRPEGVVVRRIDPESGLVLADGCLPYWGQERSELFLTGAIPATVCPARELDYWWGRQAWERLRGRDPRVERGPRVLGVPANPGRGRGRN